MIATPVSAGAGQTKMTGNRAGGFGKKVSKGNNNLKETTAQQEAV